MSRHIRADWETALLVCRKCSKKLGGGFGAKGKASLAKALKQELGAKGGRKSKIGIVEVKCLGICPKHAVTMIDARISRDEAGRRYWGINRGAGAESLSGISPRRFTDQRDHIGNALGAV